MRLKKLMLKTGLILAVLAVFSISPVWAAQINQDGTIELSIIHTNDIHARYDYGEGWKIGFAKLKTIIDQENPDLVVDAGDIFHGQSFATLETGGSIAEIMNLVGYDAMAPGNHDFNYGSQRLLELGQMANTKILGANVVWEDTGESFFGEDYLVKEIDLGDEIIKIGVFGLISPDIYNDTAPVNVAGLSFGSRESVIQTAKDSVEELENKDCDVIVALTHIGDSTNGQLMRSDEIAKAVPGIDVIIDGHTHDVENTVAGDTLIVQTGCYLGAVGEVSVSLEKKENSQEVDINQAEIDYQVLEKSEKLITAAEINDDSYPSDPEVETLIETITNRQEPIKDQVVGYTPVRLGGVSENIWQEVRTGELNLGRSLTAAYMAATGADLSIENAGGIRAQIKAGDITKGQVIDVLPFGNYLVTKSVSGEEIISMLETSIDIGLKNKAAQSQGDNSWPANSGSYLQWGGVKANYDDNAEKGNRVFDVTIGGQKLDEEGTYVIAVSNFLADQEDYPELQGSAIINEYGACDEIYTDYLETVAESEFLEVLNNQNLTAADKPRINPEESQNEEVKKQSEDNPKTGQVNPICWLFMRFKNYLEGM